MVFKFKKYTVWYLGAKQIPYHTQFIHVCVGNHFDLQVLFMSLSPPSSVSSPLSPPHMQLWDGISSPKCWTTWTFACQLPYHLDVCILAAAYEAYEAWNAVLGRMVWRGHSGPILAAAGTHAALLWLLLFVIIKLIKVYAYYCCTLPAWGQPQNLLSVGAQTREVLLGQALSTLWLVD